jgi:MFS family permease
VADGGLVTLPFPLLVGWLSDRMGRRPLLLLCFAAGAASLLILALATQLWQIWISSALQMAMGAGLGIGSALVTDLVPARRLGAGLALFGVTNWIGMIIGSAASGAAMAALGVNPALLAAALVGLLAVFLVIPIRKPAAGVAADVEPGEEFAAIPVTAAEGKTQKAPC